MGADGKWQMKLHSLAHHSPPAGWPGFYQLAHQYRSAAGGLGTPALGDLLETEPEKDKCRDWSQTPLPMPRALACGAEGNEQQAVLRVGTHAHCT